MQDGIQIGFFLGADAIAADFTTSDRLEVHRIDELIYRELVGQVGFISQHQKGNPFQAGLIQQIMKLFSRYRQSSSISSINDVPI
jgi:hypothetical protein